MHFPRLFKRRSPPPSSPSASSPRSPTLAETGTSDRGRLSPERVPSSPPSAALRTRNERVDDLEGEQRKRECDGPFGFVGTGTGPGAPYITRLRFTSSHSDSLTRRLALSECPFSGRRSQRVSPRAAEGLAPYLYRPHSTLCVLSPSGH
jgi:hypothetical protein